jgi:hypothetical protein
MSVAQKEGKNGVTIGIVVIGGLGEVGSFLGKHSHCAEKAQGNQDRNASPHVKSKECHDLPLTRNTVAGRRLSGG